MENAKCRNCGRSADTGAYCSPCADAIMARALNPSFGGKRRRPGRRRQSERPGPLLNGVCSGSWRYWV